MTEPYIRDSGDMNRMELVVVTDGEAVVYPLDENNLWRWFNLISRHLWRKRCFQKA